MPLTGRAPPRDRSRGVAALELALSLTFLVPLMLGMLDFGYYFWIGTNAEEAARAGVREAVTASGGSGCGTAPSNTAKTNGEAAVSSGTGTGCVGGAASCYMNEAPLNMGTTTNTRVTLTCLNGTTVPIAPVDPTWRISVEVNFWPATTFFKWMMPQSTVTTGMVRYTATVTSN